MDSGVTLAAKCRELMGSPDEWLPPAGYEGLALAIIDAIWSIGVRYCRITVPVLNRYRTWVRESRSGDPETRTTSMLVEDIKTVGGPGAFADNVVTNHNRTSSRNGIPKAEAVYAAASALANLRIHTRDDLVKATDDPDVKSAWRRVHGQSSGISWHYLLMNARIEDVKADRMICRFVAHALGMEKASPQFAYDEVKAAHAVLRKEAPTLTLRGLDHAMWRYSREHLDA